MPRRRNAKEPLTEVEILRRQNKMLKKVIKSKLSYIGYIFKDIESAVQIVRKEIDSIPKEVLEGDLINA